MRLSNSARSREADATGNALNLCVLKAYTGMAPATTDDAATGTLIVTWTGAADAFPAAVNGVLTANPINSAIAGASGTIGYVRVFLADGTTPVMDLKAGALGGAGVEAGMTVNGVASATVTASDSVTLSSWTYTVPAGTVP